MKSLTSGGWYRGRKRVIRDHRTYLLSNITKRTSVFLFLPSNKVWCRAVFQPKIRSRKLRFDALKNMKIDSYCIDTFLTTFVTLRSHAGLLKASFTQGSLQQGRSIRDWWSLPTTMSNKVLCIGFTKNSVRFHVMLILLLRRFSFCKLLRSVQ